jgi:hypothetical protein
MAIDQTTIDTLDTSINAQAVSPVRKLTDAIGNSFENSSLKEQIEAREMLSRISAKKTRTSMFDKFKFAKKWSAT